MVLLFSEIIYTFIPSQYPWFPCACRHLTLSRKEKWLALYMHIPLNSTLLAHCLSDVKCYYLLRLTPMMDSILFKAFWDGNDNKKPYNNTELWAYWNQFLTTVDNGVNNDQQWDGKKDNWILLWKFPSLRERLVLIIKGEFLSKAHLELRKLPQLSIRLVAM